MKPSPINLMGQDFTAQLPTLMQENLTMHTLLRRVLAEVPQIGNSSLASDIRAVTAAAKTRPHIPQAQIPNAKALSTTRLSR